MLGDAGGVAPGEQASVTILPFTSERHLGAVVFFLGTITASFVGLTLCARGGGPIGAVCSTPGIDCKPHCFDFIY